MQRKLSLAVLIIAGAGLLLLVASAPAQKKADEKFFADRVAPLLQQHCLECHAGKKARAGLDLTRRESILTGGEHGPAIVPGNADMSLLIKMIQGPNAKMPQKGEALSAGEVATMRQWIDGGAPWPKELTLGPDPAKKAKQWWSLTDLKRPSVPKVKNAGWVNTPVDAFILARLEELGLSTAPKVNRVEFLRRAKFDLHGLPPTTEEIDEFVNDTSANAFERLIDRLLESPLYGERWGRFWLDIIHYADTHGFDKDKRRLWAWLFRDWIIHAFNTDMPYHQFVTMQLAGDVLDPDNPDGIIAAGFVVAGPWDFVGHVELKEGTVDKHKTRNLDRDDMLTNVASTFLSTTVHCARCHDHKFDPISQHEYYQMQSVFAGVERGDRSFLTKETKIQLAGLQAQQQELLLKQSTLQEKIAKLTSPALVQLEQELAKWKQALAKLPALKSAKPSPSNGWHSGIMPVPGATKWVQLDLGKSVPMDEIRLLPARPTDFKDTPGFGFPVRFTVAISDDASFKDAIVLVDHSAKDYPNPGDGPFVIPVAGKKARHVRITAHKLWKRLNDYTFALAEVQVDAGGKNVALQAKVTSLDSIEAGRWSQKYLVDDYDSRNALPDLSSPGNLAAIKQRNELLGKIQQGEVKRQQLAETLIDALTRQDFDKTKAALAKLDEQIRKVHSGNKVYSVLPIPPRPIHLLKRGDVEIKKELVFPAALSLIPGLSADLKIANDEDEGQRRLALAKWITAKNNVLTWRSIVNRVWQYHFGQGLVETPNDFGKNGARPTHPELLDWLALEFRDGGQSMKKLHKLIMLSSVYRQATKHSEANAKKDADNRYLWKMNRKKLDAEAIRDSVLLVSGQMNFQMGGPGFDLFRFKDDHSPVYDHTDIQVINDPKTYRRTVYRFVVRSVPNPFLETLDCADPNISVPRRNETLTALQALALLNNPFMVKQSEYFAARLEKLSNDPKQQIDWAFRLAFSRSPTPAELTAVLAYRHKHGLANACRILFNTNEFMFVD